MSAFVDLCGDTDEFSSSTTHYTDRHIVAIVGTDIVHHSDLQRLSPGIWLNDAIISSFMTIMNDREESLFERGVIQKRSHFFDSLLIPLLIIYKLG